MPVTIDPDEQRSNLCRVSFYADGSNTLQTSCGDGQNILQKRSSYGTGHLLRHARMVRLRCQLHSGTILVLLSILLPGLAHVVADHVVRPSVGGRLRGEGWPSRRPSCRRRSSTESTPTSHRRHPKTAPPVHYLIFMKKHKWTTDYD